MMPFSQQILSKGLSVGATAKRGEDLADIREDLVGIPW